MSHVYDWQVGRAELAESKPPTTRKEAWTLQVGEHVWAIDGEVVNDELFEIYEHHDDAETLHVLLCHDVIWREIRSDLMVEVVES